MYDNENDGRDNFEGARILLRVFLSSGRRAGMGMPFAALLAKTLGMPDFSGALATAIKLGWLKQNDTFLILSPEGEFEARTAS